MNKEKKQVMTIWILTVLIVILIAIIAGLIVMVMKSKRDASIEGNQKLAQVQEQLEVERTSTIQPTKSLEKSQSENTTKKVINNGENFVKYGDDVYYWQLNDSSRENTALSARYKDNNNSKNKLVKRDLNGSETVIYEGKGSGNIFILNNKIFTSYAAGELSDREIYSIDLNGKNQKTYKSGKMVLMTNDDIICQSEKKEIFKINSKTNETSTIKENAGVLGYINNKLYYAELNENYYNVYDNSFRYSVDSVNIGYIENGTDYAKIAKVSKDEFERIGDKAIEIIDFWDESGKINMYIRYVDGSASMTQEELQVTMDYNGGNLTTKKLKMTDGGVIEDHTRTENIREDGKNYYKGEKLLISKEEIQNAFNLTIGSNQQNIISMVCADIVEDNVYAIIDYSKYSEEASIGWRDGYVREKTITFVYNTKSKEITKINEF